jgi:hypothetical protein
MRQAAAARVAARSVERTARVRATRSTASPGTCPRRTSDWPATPRRPAPTAPTPRRQPRPRDPRNAPCGRHRTSLRHDPRTAQGPTSTRTHGTGRVSEPGGRGRSKTAERPRLAPADAAGHSSYGASLRLPAADGLIAGHAHRDVAPRRHPPDTIGPRLERVDIAFALSLLITRAVWPMRAEPDGFGHQVRPTWAAE